MAQRHRHTAGQTRTALRRLMREMSVDDPKAKTDPLLADLSSAHAIAAELDLLVDQMIVSARRREPRYSWRRIGQALWMTGQAAGQRARAHHLPVDPPTPGDFAVFVAEGWVMVRRLRRTAPGR
jgi:hypothetical protein